MSVVSTFKQLGLQIKALIDGKANNDDLSEVAFSGSYEDLKNKPAIPSTEGLESASNKVTSISDSSTEDQYPSVDAVKDYVDTQLADKVDQNDLSDVATSGSYDDLTDKPVIPSIAGLATESYVDNAVSSKVDSDDLSTVALSGSYSDLSDKPIIPSIEGLATEAYVDNVVTIAGGGVDRDEVVEAVADIFEATFNANEVARDALVEEKVESISELQVVVKSLNNDINGTEGEIDFSEYTDDKYYIDGTIDGTAKWLIGNQNYKGVLIPAIVGATYHIERNADDTSLFAFVKSLGSNNSIVEFSYTRNSVGRIENIDSSSWNDIVAPEGTAYIWVCLRTNSRIRKPAKLTYKVEGTESIKTNIASLNKSVDDINSNLSLVNKDIEELKGKSKKSSDNLNLNTKIIARLGYKVYQEGFPPECSIQSYKLAYDKGYRVMLADVRKTSDGKFVNLHDATYGYSSIVRNADGTRVSSTLTIAETTLQQLDTYDWGIYKGQDYAGTKTPSIEDFFKFCKRYNCEAILEIKDRNLSDNDVISLANLCKKYGMMKGVVSVGWITVNDITRFSNAFPNSSLWFDMGTFGQDKISYIGNTSAYPAPNNNERWLYIGPTSTYSLDDIIADLKNNKDYAVSKNVGVGYTEISTEEELKKLSDNGVLEMLDYIAIKDIDLWYNFI